MRFVAALGALFVLIIAIVLLAPNLIPAKSYKPMLERAASDAIGRDVRFGDDLSFSIIPMTAFKVRDLTIANAPGFEGEHLLKVGSANIGVRLAPLLSRRIEIDDFVLVEPEILLQRRKDGAANWILTAATAGADAQTGSGAAPLRGDVHLGDVRLVSGKLVFEDRQAGQTYRAQDVNLTVRLDSLDAPLEMNGDLVFQGAPATISLVASTPRGFVEGVPTDVKLSTRLADAAIGADLDVINGETLQYSGPVDISAPDLPGLAGLFGVALADAPGFDSLNVRGAASGNDAGVRLRNAEIRFDKIEAAGDLAFAWSGAKPKASGALQVSALDLRPYMPPPTQSSAGFPAWSDAPLDFASLRNIDADFDLSADAVFLNDLELGESRMKVTVENGRLVADIPQLRAYQGGGAGRLVVNARQGVPSFSGYIDFSAIEAQPLSADLLKNDKLIGLGGLRFEFSATGSSQAAIMSSLDGEGGFDLADGAIKGINFVKLANAARTLVESGARNPAAFASAIEAARQPAEQTDFTNFLSQFKIVDGIAQAPTIQLTGPFLTMTGSGSVNLPGQTIDLRLAPRVTTTAGGETGRAFAVPLKIGGTFARPSVGVDAEALLRGEVEKRGTDLLNRVLGGKDKTEVEDPDKADETETQPESEAARKLIEGLFGAKKKDD